MGTVLERVLSVLLTLTAVVIALTLVHREWDNRHPDPRASSNGKPVYVGSWKDVAQAGHRDGAASAPVTLIEFADLECPYCGKFNSRVQAVLARHPNTVAWVFIHFPLPNHRFARPAARALECANAQGRFTAFADEVYRNQDSLGLRSWVSYARAAKVADTLGFSKCAQDTATVAAIENGIAAGKNLRVDGTPTVIVNGWRYPAPPSDSTLDSLIVNIAARH